MKEEEEEEEYGYWNVEYISCESNRRWTVIKTSDDWGESDVRHAMLQGGMGDDPAEITSVTETRESEYDFGGDYT